MDVFGAQYVTTIITIGSFSFFDVLFVKQNIIDRVAKNTIFVFVFDSMTIDLIDYEMDEINNLLKKVEYNKVTENINI